MLLANPPTPETPIGIVRTLPIWLRWKAHPVGALIAAAARHPQRTAIIDDEGSVTFGEIERRSTALARAWRALGIGPVHDRRPARAATAACSWTRRPPPRSSGRASSTSTRPFLPPQVAAWWRTRASTCSSTTTSSRRASAEATAAARHRRNGPTPGGRVREAMLRSRHPRGPGRIVVLTSGTTGRPKGAVRRGTSDPPMAGAALLASLPVIVRRHDRRSRHRCFTVSACSAPTWRWR